MVNKKSIVLNGVNDKSQRAVLTIECNGEISSGRVRLYNFGVEPQGIISLGINDGKTVTKAGLTHSSGMLFTFICELKQIPNNFSCAIVNFVNGEPKPILYGCSEGYKDKEEIFDQVITSLNKSKNVSEVESVLDTYGVDYEGDEKVEIESLIDKEVSACQKDCDNCEYKKFYLSHTKKMSNDNAENDKGEVAIENKFYNEMKKQIDDLFANNPSENYLEQLLPNSKWVKVSIDDNGDYYVLGLLYEGENLKYICYGVPGVYQKYPPRELSGYPIWFPLDENSPEGFGYWLSYQDANSGESVKAVVI